MKNIKNYYLILTIVLAVLTSCAGSDANEESTTSAESTTTEEEKEVDPMTNKGVGPIQNVELGEIDPALAKEGEAIFTANCSACHKIEKRFVGPALADVTTRRTPEWIMNMILDPEKMVAEDPTAKALLAEYLSPMANQNLTQDQARAILEYLRTTTTTTQN